VSGLLIKMLARRKVVFDVHEYVPSKFADFFPRLFFGPVKWATIRFMRLFARFTDHIILTKECLDREFEGLCVPRTVVLNTNHLQPPCTDIPGALQGRYGGRPTIIHQGQFGDKRGSYQLLDAMKIIVQEVPDVKCIIVGEYVYGDEQEYKDAIGAAGLSDAMDVYGWIPFDEVPAYVAVSRVGLILFQPIGLSHTYGMPHKMFDYMREEIPQVAPDFAIEVAQVVREADCGVLVDVTSPEEIAEAIVGLLKDPDEARRLGRNGRRIVETKYNWEQDEKKLLEVFASLELPEARAAERRSR
jgi:glycosyltransferase involved in cell wall biosynthesis